MNATRLNIAAPINGSFGSNSSSSSGASSYIFVIASILTCVILFALYYQTIGYYIQIGWDKLQWSRDQGETVKMNIPGTDVTGELTPSHENSTVMQTVEADVEAALNAVGGDGKEVFNVSRNVYSFEEAEPLCRAFGAELATYDQVKEAYDKGADWCNYGWSKGQLALYPTQESTWKKLQDGPEDQRMSCGNPGVNGGAFSNPDQRFGVNCYGTRPARTALDEQAMSVPATPFDRDVARFRSEMDTIAITPWNTQQWSS